MNQIFCVRKFTLLGSTSSCADRVLLPKIFLLILISPPLPQGCGTKLATSNPAETFRPRKNRPGSPEDGANNWIASHETRNLPLEFQRQRNPHRGINPRRPTLARHRGRAAGRSGRRGNRAPHLFHPARRQVPRVARQPFTRRLAEN